MTTTNTGRGMSLSTILTIIFVVLKLTGVITWSWWWVLSPLWISFAIFLCFITMFGVIAVIGLIIALFANQ